MSNTIPSGGGRAAGIQSLSPAGATGPLAYRAAVQQYMTDEQQAIAAQGFTQKPGNRSYALFHNEAPKGLVLMLHGYSAGTEQWSPIAQELYAQGYDIFVPALPGHGLVDKDGQDDTSRVPTAKTWKQWDSFDDRIYNLVKSSGHVSVVGLSCGGMLALKMAERHGKEKGPDKQPVIRSVVAASPFLKLTGDYTQLGPVAVKNSTVASVLRKVEKKGGKPVDEFLETQQVDMDKGGPRPIPYGFRYTNQDEVLGMDNAAKETRQNAQKVKGTPVQIIATAADDLADPKSMEEFAKKSGAAFFEFPAGDHVPHAMVNPLENPDAKSYQKVRELILANVK